MSLAVLTSRALTGMEAPPATVEVHLANGLPSFTIVGLRELEVSEVSRVGPFASVWSVHSPASWRGNKNQTPS